MPDIPPHKRILIVRPSALGDVCRTVPVLVTLKRTFPAAQIDWLVQDTFAAAISHHPDLNRPVLFHRRRLAAWHRPSVARELCSFLLSLRKPAYDLVLDCQGLARSALFTWVTGARVRVGFANAAEAGWLPLTERIEAPRQLHAADRMLLLALAVGCQPVRDFRLYSAPEDRDWAASLSGLTSAPFALFAPATRWPGKHWPQDRYLRLADRLLADRRSGIERVAVVGAESDRPHCTALSSRAYHDARFVDLIGRTGVGQLLALVERSALVVGSDSAPIHIAVGFDRPLVALYGPTDVRRVGPYGREAHVVQRLAPGDVLDHKNASAGRTLMERITVDDVFECAQEQLVQNRSPHPRRLEPASP